MDFTSAEKSVSFADEDIPLQSANDGPVKKALFDEESVLQSAKKRVINSLPVEVLVMIVRFVPRVYEDYPHSAIPTSTSKNELPEEENRPKKPISSVTDLRILTQFQLRFLSRKWAALADQQNASMGLEYIYGRLRFTDEEKDATLILSEPKMPKRCVELKELTDETVGVIARHSLLALVTRLFVRIENGFWRSEPVSAVLSKLISVITQPCELDLSLNWDTMEAVHSFVRDFDTPFQQLFPKLSLRSLTFDIEEFERFPDRFKPKPEYFQAACRCLKHFLAAGCSSLVQLNVNFFFLQAAFEIQQPGCADGDPLPADWVCESLRKLRLEFLPFETNYDYASQTLKAALFAFQGRLPKLLPRLQSLTISHGRPQFDFSVLAQLPALETLSLTGDRLQQDCNIQPLPNIRTLLIGCKMPFELSMFVPHADALFLFRFPANVLSCLMAELHSVPLSPLFQGLLKLTIVGFRDRPPYADLIGLMHALQSLPKLERLEIIASDLDDAWSRDGDLSLLSVLPAGLKYLSLKYVLVPSECVQPILWQLNVMNSGDPHLPENIYKGWLRNLLHQISTIPSLEKVHCVCVAPSFSSIVRFAEKWNRSSKYALEDLGLLSVHHVQCTGNSQRIRVADAFQRGDALRFRFNVSPTAQFERPLAKKIVSVTFVNQ